MRRSHIIFLLLCFLLALGCGHGTVRTDLDRVDSILESDPEGASVLLDSISPRTVADSARHALYRLVTIGKLTGMVDNDSLLSMVRDFYRGNDPDRPDRDAMIADYYLGTEAMEKGHIAVATRLLTAAKEAGEILRDTAYLCRIYGHLAILSQDDYNGPAYIDYSRKALEMALVADTANAVYDMMRLADAYSSVEKDSVSWEILDRALNTYKAKCDKKVRHDILAQYGVTKALNNVASESAIRMFEEALDLGPLDVNSHSAYAWALVTDGNVSKGLEQLRVTAPMVQSSDDSLYYHHYAYCIYYSLKDYKQAMYHYRLSNIISNRFLIHRLDQPTYAGKETYYRGVSDTLRAERQARIYREWLTVVLVLVSVVFTGGIIWWRWRKRRYEYAMLSASLSTAHAELDLLRRNMTASLEDTERDKD
ncbi:MAG: hypothetical protein K2K26_08590, partial [Muribaculaceae bacterium]|nr:hypothetical protein [Muribaculaceae bacterium]